MVEDITMSKLEQIKLLENGKGIQYLLDIAKDIFTNHISILDMNYNLIAYSDYVFDDPFWNTMIETKKLSPTMQEIFSKSHILEDIINMTGCIIIRNHDLKHARLIRYFYNKENIKVGIIGTCEHNTPFDDDYMAAFNLFADKISSEIQNDEHFTAFGRAFHEETIKKLLDGAIKDSALFAPNIQILYDGFEDYLYVAVVDISQNNKQLDNPAVFKNLLLNKFRSYKYAIYSGYIVIITSSKHKYPLQGIFVDKDCDPFIENNLFVGISSSFENLYKLRTYYDQAVTALKNGLNKNDAQRIFLYNNNH